MADYKELLRKAVEALPENNGAARRDVYEKARHALVAQLRAIDPPLPSREITQHRLQLEDCIRQVELEATEEALGGFKSVEGSEAGSSVSLAPVTKDKSDTIAGKSESEKPVENTEKPESQSDTGPTTPAPATETDSSKTDLPDWAKPRSERKSTPAGEAGAEDESSGNAVPPVSETSETSEADSGADAAEDHSENVKSDDTDDSGVPEWAKPLDRKHETSEGAAADQPKDKTDPGSGGSIEDIIAKAEQSRSVSPTLPSAPESDTDEPESDELPGGSAPYTEPDRTTDGTDGELATASIRSRRVPQSTVSKTSAAAIASRLTERPEPDVGTAMSSVLEVDVEDADDDAQHAIDRAIETLDREARGESSPVADDAEAGASADGTALEQAIAAAEDDGDGESGSNALTIFLVLLVLLLGGSGGAAYWAWQEGYLDPETLFAQVTSLGGNGPTETPAVEPDTSEASSDGDGPGNTTTAVDTELDEDELPKSEERLDVAGDGSAASTETPEDTATAETDDQTETTTGTPDATTEVAATADTNNSDAATETEGTGTVDTADTADPPDTLAFADTSTPGANDEIEGDKSEERLPGADASEQVADIEPQTDIAQSLLLEASSSGSTGAVPFSGTIDWSRGVDEFGVPTIMASASIPARNLNVNVLIRKNSDETLPASHLMEINFSVSDTFVGGAIAGLPGVLLKNEELVQGVPLVGASARVVGNSFLFALSGAEQDVSSNLGLLADRKWMDLAMIYATGRRAIITLEKDDAAEEIFDDVLAEWQAIDDAAASAAEAAASEETASTAGDADTATDLLADEGVDAAQ